MSFRTFEEFYYLTMGIQYTTTPAFITEHQWNICGIETPVSIVDDMLNLYRCQKTSHVCLLWLDDNGLFIPNERFPKDFQQLLVDDRGLGYKWKEYDKSLIMVGPYSKRQ